MTITPRHSVGGCAVGFGFAGAAVGLFAGLCWYAADVRWFAPGWVAAMRESGSGNVSYWYIFKTNPLGWLAGTAAGVWYANRANRTRTRR